MDQLIPGLAALVEAFRDCFHPQVFSTFQSLDRRLDRLPRPSHHQRGLAGHRPGRQAAPRHRLRRLPLRRLGVGRPGHRPGHLDPHPPGPRRRRLGRRRRHPLPQARGQGRLRRHLPRRRPLVEEAQDLPVRPQLGRAGHRRADPDARRPLLLPAGALAALPQEGAGRATSPAPSPPPSWPGSWPRPTPSGPSGWSATVPTSTRRVLQGRPANLQVIGPLHWKAALYDRPAPRQPKQKGAPRKKGERLPTPKAMIEDTATYPAELMTIAFPKLTRELRVQVIRDVLWYRGSKTDPVMVVLVRDPLGQWRDEALVATDPTCLGGVRDPGILPEMECGTGVLRQQTAPRLARPAGAERAERGAGAPDGVVRGIADDPVVLRGGSWGLARREGPSVVHDEGDADVHGHAGCVTVADVGARDLWRVRRGSALARMHQKAAPQAIGRGLRSESLVGPASRRARRSRMSSSGCSARRRAWASGPGCSCWIAGSTAWR